ncbi:C40 family peptidase [Hyalangium gracile]|uniref:C40 family peptidase n=1 Tax=Hyalangium gracile TaxID=394092 RepID=UPI001CCCCA3E|nr:peptidoglycan-binding protein [Hyalangium gracile]
MVAPISSSRVTTQSARSSNPTLREGSRGPAVRDLQNLLKSKGFNPGGVDGVFGPKTKAAVLSFQRAQGISVDGIVGPQTWGKLKGAGGSKPPSGPTPGPAAKGTAEDFVQKALAQRGDRYVFGAETNLNDKNPDTFDCSELVQWAAHQAGVSVPDGTMNQVPFFRQKGTQISVDQALKTRGALLYRPGHVAISLGDGRTIEARGKNYGVNIFNANGRGWTSGALIPGLKY